LQEILEARGLAFVGSGSTASRIGMDKAATKDVWIQAGIPTPRYDVVTTAQMPFPGPAVVKAIDSGSSIDVLVCKDAAKVPGALAEVVAKHGRALVEQFVDGVELTVGILEERALHPIRITTTHEFFDFNAKYKGNDAQHHFDLRLPADVVKLVQKTALEAHNAIGCRDLSRVDVIVDGDLKPWLLEINTLPGFTPKSLLPEMAAHEGIAFGPLVDLLVKRAYHRKTRGQ
jgi:D-alanine-D-alanine ligase